MLHYQSKISMDGYIVTYQKNEVSRKWNLSGRVHVQVIRENKQHGEDDSS